MNARVFRPAYRCGARGFTLIEMMIVVALVAILSAVAVPSFRDLLLNQRLASTASDFIAALSLARSEAMKRSQKTTLTATSRDWNNGWEVTTAVDDESAVLRTFEALRTGIEVDTSTGNGFDKSIAFDANGFSRASAGCVTFRASTGRRSAVVLSVSGRARICDPDKKGDCGGGSCGKG